LGTLRSYALAPRQDNVMVSVAERLHTCMPDESSFNAGSSKLCILVLPGGGYCDVEGTLGYEGIRVAEWFCSRGLLAFALQYTLGPFGWHGRAASVGPAVEDGIAALSAIRARAKESGYIGHGQSVNICILGFSAGAHLAMCICREAAEKGEQGPEAAILAYPPARSPNCPCIIGSLIFFPKLIDRVMPWGRLCSESGHRWCDMDQMAHYMPPTLLVASLRDRLLPPAKHSDKLAAALTRQGVSVTYLCQDFGWHGFALNGWKDQCESWLHGKFQC